MTLPCTAINVLRTARAEIGQRESPAGSNRQKYGNAYGMNGVPWCAIFVWWVFQQNGTDLRGIASGLHWTPTFANGLEAAGWKRIPFPDVRAGDVVFFDFPDRVTRIQHVGIANASTSGDTIITIEGNTSITSDDNGGEVMLRRRHRSVVARIIRPPYKQHVLTPTEALVRELPEVKRGDEGEDVQTVQALLKARSHSEVSIDGEFGPATERAVKAVQRWGGVKSDGIVGAKTWAVLLRVHR